jgi:NTE family protein
MGPSDAKWATGAPTPDPGAFAEASFLAGLPEESRDRLRDHAESVRLKMGEWLFHEGEPADCAYVVRSGRLDIVSEGQVIRAAQRGAVIGELALLTGGTRAASVCAQRDCRLWRVGRYEFEHLIMADQQFALALCRVLGSKLAEHRSPVTHHQAPRRIAIIALDTGVSSDDLAARLAAELAPAGQTSVILPDQLAADAEHAAAIERAEAVSRWVVLSAGAAPGDAWTDTCITEADRIIAISRGRPTRQWIEAAPLLRGCELLILGTSAADALVRALEPGVVQILHDETAVRRARRAPPLWSSRWDRLFRGRRARIRSPGGRAGASCERRSDRSGGRCEHGRAGCRRRRRGVG